VYFFNGNNHLKLKNSYLNDKIVNNFHYKKKYFNEVYFTLLESKTHLSNVAVFSTKPSLKNVFLGVFLNLWKSLSKLLLNTMGFKTSIKYYRFQNFRKIPWVSKPS